MATPLFPTSQFDSEKDAYLDTAIREHATTVAILKAFPSDQLDLKPSPKSQSARDLAFRFVLEQGMIVKALTTGFDWTAPAKPPEAPDSLKEIVAGLEKAHAKTLEVVRATSQEDLRGKTAKFMVGPKKFADVALMDFIWMVLYDQIHHRGQMSVYLRMAGGKVPAIYGPSGDETWR